ncbi:MAG: glycerol-3-phosphate dehydrogenase/oxidase [Phycisphaerae bacterium]|nr:glycerol-3-phosphate dehydrogenase/oxidase [Phycisphaerae bacterium]
MSDQRVTRADVVAALTDGPFDVLVAGGGIVGAGVARDAALRGLRVALVDQHDFAFGTSSRSSRLLHGGLRYLAQGRLGLVREASVEKRIVHNLAPQICAPLPFVLPTYRGAPWAAWALWKLRIGVRIYDWLCSGHNFGRSGDMNPAQTADHLPGVQTANLTGAVRYFDGLTNDARLTIDTVRSAAKAGACAVNYCKLEEAVREAGTWRCVLTDRLSGRELRVTSRSVVNATGPWGQQFAQRGIPLRLTKGIHMVIERDRLPIPAAVVMTEGKRILFAIPWGERVILGTTDTDYAGPLEDVFADADDIAYVLQVTNESFPPAALSVNDVVSTWAGLRPLIANPHGRPSDISRSHKIRMSQPGWYDVAGGKLTTYRLIAEQTVDQLEQYLGRRRTPCCTALVPLLEPPEVGECSTLVPGPVSATAVEYCCHREWAIHLDDVMIRRTGWHHYHRDAGRIAAQVAQWMGACLGWNDAERDAELARYQRQVGASRPSRSDRPQPAVTGVRS